MMMQKPMFFYTACLALTFIITGFLITAVAMWQLMKRKQQTAVLQQIIQEQERTMKRISIEVHDNLNQMLNLISMTVHMMEMKNEESEIYKDNTIDMLGKVIRDAHYISRSLNTDFVMQGGFLASLQQIVDWVNLSKKLDCSLKVDGSCYSLTAEKELMVVRIVQEAVNNAIKYARATKLQIIVRYEPRALRVNFMDNGLGFDASAENFKEGIGLRGMRQRARSIQAKFALDTKPGKGVNINLAVPRNLEGNLRTMRKDIF